MSTQEPQPDTDDTDDQSPGQFAGEIRTDTLETALDALDAAAREAVFRFQPDGLVAHNVAPSNAIMAEVEVPAESWASYDSTGLEIGFGIGKLQSLTGLQEMTRLTWNTNVFKLDIETGPAKAQMAGVDPDMVRTQDLSSLDHSTFTTQWTVPIDDLKTALKISEPVGAGSYADVIVDPSEDFIGIEKVGDTDSVEVAFDGAEYEDGGEPDGRVAMICDPGFLKDIRRAVPNDVTLSCATAGPGIDFPMRIEYEADGVSVMFMVAPRVDRK